MRAVQALRDPGHLHPGHPAAPAHQVRPDRAGDRAGAAARRDRRAVHDPRRRERAAGRLVSDELAAVVKEFGAERRTTLIDGDLKEVLAASAPAGPAGGGRRPVPGDPLRDRAGRPYRGRVRGGGRGAPAQRPGQARRRPGRGALHRPRPGAAGDQRRAGRSRPTCCRCRCCPSRPARCRCAAGCPPPSWCRCEPGETVVGLAPLGEPGGGLAGPGAGHPAGRGEGLRAGVAGPLRRVRGDRAAGRRRGGRGDLAHRRHRDARVRHLGRVAAAVRRRAGPPAGPQGRRHGRHQPAPPGAEVVFFGAVRTDDPEHGEPMVVTSTGRDGQGHAVRGRTRRRGGRPAACGPTGSSRARPDWRWPGSGRARSGRPAPASRSSCRTENRRRDGSGFAGAARPGGGRPPDRTRLTVTTGRTGPYHYAR